MSKLVSGWCRNCENPSNVVHYYKAGSKESFCTYAHRVEYSLIYGTPAKNGTPCKLCYRYWYGLLTKQPCEDILATYDLADNSLLVPLYRDGYSDTGQCEYPFSDKRWCDYTYFGIYKENCLIVSGLCEGYPDTAHVAGFGCKIIGRRRCALKVVFKKRKKQKRKKKTVKKKMVKKTQKKTKG